MKDIELWNEFVTKNNIVENKTFSSWQFGISDVQADELSTLVVSGKKTATASAHILYELEGEEIPKEGEYSIILNSKNEAVCIIQTSKVYITPFNKVSENHAYKEGEGDRSLRYWQKVHEEFFKKELSQTGLEFETNMNVVCEEFEVVYKS